MVKGLLFVFLVNFEILLEIKDSKKLWFNHHDHPKDP
jgi:hypothetical protein